MNTRTKSEAAASITKIIPLMQVRAGHLSGVAKNGASSWMNVDAKENVSSISITIPTSITQCKESIEFGVFCSATGLSFNELSKVVDNCIAIKMPAITESIGTNCCTVINEQSTTVIRVDYDVRGI